MQGTGRKEKGDPLNSAIDKMTKKTRDLRRQLRKAVMDHISDSFLETNVPLLVLIEAAKSGNEKEVKEYAQVFREHANKLVEVGLRDRRCGLAFSSSYTLPDLTDPGYGQRGSRMKEGGGTLASGQLGFPLSLLVSLALVAPGVERHLAKFNKIISRQDVVWLGSSSPMRSSAAA
ncbi:hypothetical protein Z043_101749 [Scleropages formosus]|uniref:Catenin alpha-2-like n=1 Tax=Scleropages formosus TaxID=113540 RepID=A0A0N8K2U7_SCLFO|nr:hypothetical protein Z043_101749 [Scleropages formosus]